MNCDTIYIQMENVQGLLYNVMMNQNNIWPIILFFRPKTVNDKKFVCEQRNRKKIRS